MPVVDLFMMDIKHMDPVKHKEATGVSNERILANARRLAASGKPVLFRIPVIPTVNDTVEEMSAIAAFVHELGRMGAAAVETGNTTCPSWNCSLFTAWPRTSTRAWVWIIAQPRWNRLTTRGWRNWLPPLQQQARCGSPYTAQDNATKMKSGSNSLTCAASKTVCPDQHIP